MTAAWDGELYSANTAHHRAYDAAVLEGVSVPADGRIVDIGCGVGDFTRSLAALVPSGSVLGLDSSAEQIAAARAAGEGERVTFATCAAQRLGEVVPAGSADLVISVACLHWVPWEDHPAVLREVGEALKQGGTFRAEFGGAGQIADARRVLDEESERLGGPVSPWTFPTDEEYRELLVAAGFDVSWVRLLRQRRSMPTLDALLGWLRSQVSIAYLPRLDASVVTDFTAAVERRVVAELRRPDGTYDQDYVRLDLLVRAAG